jgi:hypothetical protein
MTSAPLAADLALLERIAALALAAIHREYPNHLLLLATSDDDLRPPRELTPSFYGCFGWHSAVHGHWTLARLARLQPDAAYAADARAALGRDLTAAALAAEHAFVARPERAGFERPYGLAWLLQLDAELHGWARDGDADAALWAGDLATLARLARERLAAWLPRLRWPIRSGEHAQTAFALGLALDWARSAGDAEFAELVIARARAFHLDDTDAPIEYEPSGHDFLSPALGEADLMRRVLAPGEFATWLGRFLPDVTGAPAARWLTPVRSTDPADGKLAHLDGLNLSRAWMLEGVAAALPRAHAARTPLERAASAHREAGLTALSGEEYAGTHWLGSFAAYLVTARGRGAP